jgi:predicted Zn-dependent protease
MKKLALMILSSFLLLGSCSKVPVTGRQQLDIVPNNEVLSMANQNYRQFLDTNKLSTDASKTAMVKRVGSNIAAAVEKYMKDNNLQNQIKDYHWEFNLVESNQVNAWCMPGGKVVVYTGILPLTASDAELAVVLGHEISHAIAKHGNERMSQGLLEQMGGMALSVALSNKPAATKNLFLSAYGAGAEVGILLPYSRKQEAEADHLGLIFMSMAGYDPRVAIDFWTKMQASSKGAPPEFLSDHPSDQNRINEIQKEMPEALKYYNKSTSSR